MLEFFLLVLLELLSKSHPQRFFMHELPSELVDLWPRRSGELRKQCRQHFGLGRLLDPSLGLHETHQFTVFTPIYHRLLHDPRRTLDPNEASAFFIPYDVGFDAAVKKDNAKIRPHGCPHAERVINLMKDNFYFKRNYGFDHFVVQGINQAMGNFNLRPACKLFLKGFCENCTKLAIDTYINCGPSPHWHAIPFPSNFHWSSNVTNPPWLDYNRPRKYAVSFTGSTSSFSMKSVVVRKKMKSECEKHPECFVDLMKSHFDVKISNASGYTNLESVFCLNPPGDMPTRKGYFDSILAGCIPVTTDRYSARDQWLWHLGKEIHDKTSIYIPRETFLNQSFDFMQYLVELVHEGKKVTKMRKNIAKYASRLQYRYPEKDSPRKPPIDAVDVIIEKIFETNENVQSLVHSPSDRGDWKDFDKFPYYPVGRMVTDFKLEKGESRNISMRNIQQWEHAYLYPS